MKALAAEENAVMLGSMFAGTDEKHQKQKFSKAVSLKHIVGCKKSIAAMKKGSMIVISRVLSMRQTLSVPAALKQGRSFIAAAAESSSK